MLIRTRLNMKITMVDIRARHKYRTIRCGSLYIVGLFAPVVDFLRSIGRLEEYEPEVSREETGEEGYEE